MSAIIPLSLYIHFPWCVRKCPYCDFNSHAIRGDLSFSRYIDVLIENFKSQISRFNITRPIHTIFMGGGTPSLFGPKDIKKLLENINNTHPLAPNLEITLEANPGTTEQDNFMGYLEAGINRLSLGVQSFNDINLKKLGRIHDSKQASIAIQTAQAMGFKNINIDIMYGLPHQTIAQALEDLQQAIECKPNHISWYQLTLEPNTVFYKHPPKLPNSDYIIEMEIKGRELLKAHGFIQYEVSAYSQPNLASQHNINYWEFGDYLGIGAGAHGKLSDISNKKFVRTTQRKQPDSYQSNPKPIINPIDKNQLGFEFMLGALRLYDKQPWERLYNHTGLDKNNLLNPLNKAQNLNLLDYNHTHFWVTKHGRNFLNDLQGLFL